jgi:CHAT domain-containing protein
MEDRQNAYLELVRSLLECEGGTEADILQAHPELVDEGLVMTMLGVAQMMTEENDPESASTIEWLNDFATQLAQTLDLDPESDSGNTASQLKFLMTLFQAIAESSGNPQVIYPLFRDNLSLLNESLIPLLTTWHQTKFAEVDEDGKQFLAAVLVEFAILIAQFPLGSRLINLEIAIECYQLALSVYTLEAYPEDWATTQMNLAVAYQHRIRGERAANLEQSIECYQLALSVRTRDAYPEQWAMTQMNLAVAYSDRIRGERAANLEQSIECYQLALSVYTLDAYPEQWATTQMNLAVAYSDRIRGERAANLEQSIECYQLALSVRTRDAYPEQWAMTQMNLAVAYRNRIRGERAANLEQSIACYQLALSVYTLDAYPEQWATTQMNLATAYSDRIRGERAANLELSIACYELALSVYTLDAYPEDWAMTHMNLAGAYQQRIRGERAANLELSIACYELALSVYTLAAYPEQWAMTHMNLAGAYQQRIRGERAANLELSIACYELALSVYTLATYPEQWATTQMNLAVAYRNRIRGERAANLELSIACYKLALSIRTLDADPERWAMTQENLAILYAGEGKNEEAIEYYQQSLTIFTPATFPINALKANRGLGKIYFTQGEWQQAVDAYAVAIEAAETSRNWATNEDERQRIIREAISVYENTIQAYINLGRIDLAITTSERARSRQLVDFMRTNDLYPDAEIPAEVRAYFDEYEALERQIQDQQIHPTTENSDNPRRQIAATRDSRALTKVSEIVKDLEAQKQAVWRKIWALDPELATKRQIMLIDLPTIQGLITTPNTAILSFYTTDDDTHIFIITPNRAPQIHTCTGQGWENLQLWLREYWLDIYTKEDPNKFEFRDAMQNVLAELATRLQLDTLIGKLEGISELKIVPHLHLHQIPFAAMPITDGDRTIYLGEKFTIDYTPSCQILKYCHDRSPLDRDRTQHGTIENADGTLPGAEFEGAFVANLFKLNDRYRLQGRSQATIAGFQSLMATTDLPVTNLHFANHANSRLDNPLESALQLADGNLGLDRLMISRYPHLHEVFLSCCETHLGATKITDDILTIGTGFLCAGARSVISTLWSVDDLATALFSMFYYHNRYDNISRARSLKKAQVRLRNLTGDEFKLNYRDDLEQHLQAYAKANIVNRKELEAQFDLGEIDKVKFDRDYERVTKAYTHAFEIVDSLDRYCEKDKPFTDPYYWAGFICQGLA